MFNAANFVYAGLDLSPAISAQFTFEMCVAKSQPEITKNSLKLLTLF